MYDCYSPQLPGNLPGEKILDYWTPGSQMLADPIHFLYTMEHFNKENITEEMINKLKDYIENPNFQPDKVNIALHRLSMDSLSFLNINTVKLENLSSSISPSYPL